MNKKRLNDLTGVEWVPISSLVPRTDNPRIHSKSQISLIGESIEYFGWTNPILATTDDVIVCGHGRYLAAKRLKMEKVPVLRIGNMSDADLRAYVIADNRLAEISKFDDGLLKTNIEGILEVRPDFKFSVIGFDDIKLSTVLDFDLGNSKEINGDVVSLPDPDKAPISRLGDKYKLGGHVLLCADAREKKSFKRLLGRTVARLIIIDPPYNRKISGAVGRGKIRHREFVMASGELSPDEFISFLTKVFGNLAECSVDGAVHYVFMDWPHLREALLAGSAAYSKLLNICTWAKTAAGLGSFYRSQTEFVLVFKHGTERHRNNFGLGQGGRHRSNLWTYAGANTMQVGRLEDLALHPTIKPLSLIADVIKDSSRRNDVVVDCFAGSGTILIAAEVTGRRAYAMELDPRYVDTAILRWQKYTGEDAIHAETGRTFAQTATDRGIAIGVPHGA